MEAHTFQASGSGKALESVFGVPMLQRPTQLRGKNQPVGIVPHGAHSKLRFRLACPLVPQCGHCRRRGGDRPRFSAFGGDEQPRRPVLQSGQLLVDVDSASLEVHRIPGEAQQFGQAKPGKQGHSDQVFQLFPFGGGQQRGHLLIVKWVNFLLLQPGKLTPRRRVPGDIVQLHSLF